MPVIATNISANSALVYLNRNSSSMDKSLAKLSSGSRIVVASDDAAGLAVANRLQANISTLKQASANTVQASAVLKTADGALTRIGDILQRMKALTAQSISGAVDATSRGFIDTEYQQLLTEIGAIETSATFNGTALLDGSYTGALATYLVGTDATNDTIIADLSSVDVGALTSLGTDVTTSANAVAAATAIDDDIDEISTARSTVGALIARFEFRGDYVSTAIENLEAAKSTIMDVDIASEQTNMVSKQVLTEASIAALAQANQMKSSLLSLVR